MTETGYRHLTDQAYRICQGFRLMKRDDHFQVNQCYFIEAAGAIVKIGSSLKSNHHNQVKPS